MLKNNNRAAVKRLTARSIKSNRTRNLFAVLAIVLTTLMIFSIFSIGISFLQNFNRMQIRTAGTTASIFLASPTQEQYDQIKQIDTLEAVGVQLNIGSVTQKTAAGKDAKIALLCYDQTEWESHYTPAISDIEGAYPEQADEIMLSQGALKQLGIQSPKLGMEIPLQYATKSGSQSDTFRLSGWFTDYEFSDAGRAFLSEAYCEQNGITLEQNGRIAISTKKSAQSDCYDQLTESVPLKTDQKFDATFTVGEDSNVTVAVIVVALALFIVLSGYLLIYNVLYISVSKDIQFYGMLKTIGTSPKQIRSIVHGQALRFAAVGIPIGLVLGVAVSFAIVPLAMGLFTADESMQNTVSFHPLIFLGTIAFSLLTVLVSCRKPAKIAAKVSPVEALKYTGVTSVKTAKNRKSTHGSKLYRMAWHNVFRDKKRAVLVFLSLFMGTITFLSVNGVIGSLGVDAYLARYVPHDFTYASEPPIVEKFDEEFCQSIESLDGVMYFETTKGAYAEIAFDAQNLEPILRTDFERYSGDDSGTYENMADTMESLAQTGEYGTWVYAIDPSYVEQYNKTHDQPIDVDAFTRGETAILGYDDYSGMIGRNITLTGGDSGQTQTAEVGGAFTFNDCKLGSGSHLIGAPECIFVSQALMEKLDADAPITNIIVDVESDKEPQIKQSLKQLNATLTEQTYTFSAKTDVAASFVESMQGMNVLGSGISILLIVIGVLNFVNVMITGVYTRRRELAVMESVGMTKKQVRKMLTFEGGYYAIVTTLLILTVGSGILYLFAKAVPNIADYAVFQYPYGWIAVLLALIFLICLSVPSVVYRATAKESITQRLHNTDN